MQSTKITIRLHYTTIRLTINKNLFKMKRSLGKGPF